MYDLIFRWKMKDDLSQKRHRNIIFSVYSVKMVFLFPTNMILPLCQERRSSPEKIHLKMHSGIIEKDDIHPKKISYFFW